MRIGTIFINFSSRSACLMTGYEDDDVRYPLPATNSLQSSGNQLECNSEFAVNSFQDHSAAASSSSGVMHITTVDIVPPVAQSVAQHPMITRTRNGIYKPCIFLSECVFPSGFLTELEPKSMKSAMQDHKWLDAMKDEFQALHQNNTWTFCTSYK
ncbi:hypothetical protein LWI29_002829 [Acer saccharum]|uniref:Gag-Pol polyprotein n=1 Tax=Acer saccharum TaxID=4024 RepID=A0AA39S0Q2_ACESA|nr:hypothetical protein LWI29_002829 [Acer saccharum]